MDPELKALMDRLAKEWAEFKVENDRRLAEIAKTGKGDPLVEQKIDKHAAAIGVLEKQIRELETKAARPGGIASEADELKAQHRKASAAYLRKGVTDGLAELQVKALQIGVDADGGFAIAEELERTVGTMERQLTPMEAEVTSITAGAETYEKLIADGMAASGWVGETAARPETGTPTLASFKPTYGELYANPRATQKMLDDAFFDVEAWLAAEVAEKFAQDVDAAIVSGDGANKPKGILAYTLAATADSARAYGTLERLHSGTAGDFDGDDLIDLVHKLRPGYRQGAKWAMAGTTVAKCRKFKDTTNNYLYQPSLVVGAPSTLLGYPIIEDENVPVVAASAYAALFGNFKRAYKLVNLRGIRVLRDPYTAKPYVHFYTTKRVGGGVEDTRAVKALYLAV